MGSVHHIDGNAGDVEHRFVDITEDLVLAVVFGPPEGSLG